MIAASSRLHVSHLSIDLHSHSHRSDGALSPTALMQRASLRAVSVIALTDHDTVDGADEASDAAREHGILFVPGVEISVTWSGRTLHVVGLGIDPGNAGLQSGLRTVRAGRLQRARGIASRLQALGIRDTLDGALGLAANPEMVSRTHFARYLVATGHCKDLGSAFRRYLGEGKPAHVRHAWACLPDAIAWINGAGGVAVLAHPGRYGLRRARQRALFEEFRALGGVAVEVVTGSHSEEQMKLAAHLAVECGLLASAGSDFHSPAESWLDLGQLAPLPQECTPLWQHPRCPWLQ
jgi:predicted metal-dependent phosphoesterase TrpH